MIKILLLCSAGFVVGSVISYYVRACYHDSIYSKEELIETLKEGGSQDRIKS